MPGGGELEGFVSDGMDAESDPFVLSTGPAFVGDLSLYVIVGIVGGCCLASLGCCAVVYAVRVSRKRSANSDDDVDTISQANRAYESTIGSANDPAALYQSAVYDEEMEPRRSNVYGAAPNIENPVELSSAMYDQAPAPSSTVAGAPNKIRYESFNTVEAPQQYEAPSSAFETRPEQYAEFGRWGGNSATAVPRDPTWDDI